MHGHTKRNIVGKVVVAAFTSRISIFAPKEIKEITAIPRQREQQRIKGKNIQITRKSCHAPLTRPKKNQNFNFGDFCTSRLDSMGFSLIQNVRIPNRVFNSILPAIELYISLVEFNWFLVQTPQSFSYCVMV